MLRRLTNPNNKLSQMTLINARRCTCGTFCCVLLFSSEKLRICQANRRTEPPAVRVGKRKPAEPFFSGPGKNALIITGGWLVRSR